MPDPDAAIERAARTTTRRRAARTACRRAGPAAGSRPGRRARPRRTAVRSARVSGTKYAVAIRTRSSRELQECEEQGGDVAPARLRRPADRLDHASTRLGLFREAVDRPGRRGSSSVSIQLSRKAARRPSTAGPRTRKCVSRHSRSSRASPSHSSAMPTPPVNPTASSTIITLRWVRWFTVSSWSRASGRNHRIWTPASSIIATSDLSIGVRAPRVEEHAHPHTGPRSLGQSASANLVPISPAPVDERQEVDRVLAPARSLRAWPGRSRRRCAGPRSRCPRSRARR